GGRPATGQQPMADADHAPAFWASVAGTFRDVPGVVFDLYNEPRLDTLAPGPAWACWRQGCTYDGWATAGVQTLVGSVRGAGARQPVVVAGLRAASDLSGWLGHEPVDPPAGGLGPQL